MNKKEVIEYILDDPFIFNNVSDELYPEYYLLFMEIDRTIDKDPQYRSGIVHTEDLKDVSNMTIPRMRYYIGQLKGLIVDKRLDPFIERIYMLAKKIKNDA